MRARNGGTMENLRSKHSDDEFHEIGKHNFESFQEMKEFLVEIRKRLCSLEDMAMALSESESEVAGFEQYYSDPTLSQVQKYALAIGVKIDITYWNIP